MEVLDMSNTNIGKVFRQIRRRKEMTQKQVSNRLGITTNCYISKFERGESKFSKFNIVRYFHAIGCDVKFTELEDEFRAV